VEDATEERAVESQPPFLAHHVGVVGDNGGARPAQQPIGDLAQWVGGVNVGYIRAEAGQRDGLAQAERH